MKKPEKVWMLIATTTVLLSTYINRAEALVIEWKVTGSQNFTGSGTITVAGNGPLQTDTEYTITAATGSISYNDGIGDIYGPNAAITWPGDLETPQTFETDAQGDILQTQGSEFAFDADGWQWHLESGDPAGVYDVPGFVYFDGAGPNPEVETEELTVESAPVPLEVPGGASIPAVGTLLALGVMRKVRTFKKA